jgi:ERCC4-type nuclease
VAEQMKTSNKEKEEIKDNCSAVITKQYSSVIAKEKCKNITTENIDEIFLCQIPYIHSKTARGLIKHFGSFYELQKRIKDKTDNLENIRINERKLSVRVIQTLREYICATKKEIKIVTE